MKQYTLVLNFGYVESASMSYLPFTSVKKYKSAKDAVLDLAAYFKEEYLKQYTSEPKKCCTASTKADAAAAFCSKCGKSLKEVEFNSRHFEEWLVDMSGSTVDSFSEHIEYDDGARWQSAGLGINQRIIYNAEWVLSAALGYPHRAEQTFENICEDRTKEKREDFMYY